MTACRFPILEITSGLMIVFLETGPLLLTAPPSTGLVSIPITSTLNSHTIRQKSDTVLFKGPGTYTEHP